MPAHTPPTVEKAILDALTDGVSLPTVARDFGVDKNTVRAIVRRNQTLQDTMADVKGDHMASGFKYVWSEALDDLRRRVESGDVVSAQDRKNYALAMAISVDKIALIAGWPTQVVAHLHEHRHNTVDLAEKLAEVALRLKASSISRERGT